MERLVIAVDCDDVLVPATPYVVNAYNQLHGTRVQIERAHESGNTEWGDDRTAVHDQISAVQRSDGFAEVMPFSDAIDVIARLAKVHELHLITARDPSLTVATKAMLDRYFPSCFVGMEHVGIDGTKGDICKNIGADVLVDDNLKHIQSARDAGVKNLVWFGDYPWQDRTIAAPEGTIRCANWHDVEAEIERIAG